MALSAVSIRVDRGDLQGSAYPGRALEKAPDRLIRDTLELSMFARESVNGFSIQYRIPVNLVMKPGHPIPTNTWAGPMLGAG